MNDNLDTRKIIFIGSVIFGLIFIAFCVYLLIPRSYIKFETAPSKVVVLIDNDRHQINTGDSLMIAPGKHDIVVFEDEFNPYQSEITVKNGETYDFAVALIGLTQNAKNKLNDSSSDAAIQKFSNTNTTHITDILSSRYPILQILPIQARQYIISSCKSVKYPNDPTTLALCVDIYPPSYDPSADIKTDALKDIEFRGYNPSDYEIIWNIVNS